MQLNEIPTQTRPIAILVNEITGREVALPGCAERQNLLNITRSKANPFTIGLFSSISTLVTTDGNSLEESFVK
jgi:hypothetical protein